VADRVNLGLIPSAEASYGAAVASLKSFGGILHVHGNVNVGKDVPDKEEEDLAVAGEEALVWKHLNWRLWARRTSKLVANAAKAERNETANIELLHIYRVKSYGPRVDHVVLDLRCSFS
jgi:tRNA G37 N-methylase Trm5